MNIDGTTTLLAASAAALFVTGGMVLRWALEGTVPATAPAPIQPSSKPPALSEEAPRREAGSISPLQITRPPSAEEERTSATILRVEAEHAATRDRLEHCEIELLEAKGEIDRLSSELDTKQSVMQQMGSWLDEERVKLKAAQEQLEILRAEAEKEPPTYTLPGPPAVPGQLPRIPRPESMRPPDAAAFATLRAEVADVRKKLEQAVRDRESAEAKVKALETLVEAVRARSRELAQQVARNEASAEADRRASAPATAPETMRPGDGSGNGES